MLFEIHTFLYLPEFSWSPFNGDVLIEKVPPVNFLTMSIRLSAVGNLGSVAKKSVPVILSITSFFRSFVLSFVSCFQFSTPYIFSIPPKKSARTPSMSRYTVGFASSIASLYNFLLFSSTSLPKRSCILSYNTLPLSPPITILLNSCSCPFIANSLAFDADTPVMSLASGSLCPALITWMLSNVYSTLPALVALPLYWFKSFVNSITLSSPAIIITFVLPSCSSTFITLIIVFALTSPNDSLGSDWKCCLRYDNFVVKSIGSFCVPPVCERKINALPFTLLAVDCTF